MKRNQPWNSKKRCGHTKRKIRKEYENILRSHPEESRPERTKENDSQVRVQYQEGSVVSSFQSSTSNVTADNVYNDFDQVVIDSEAEEVRSDTNSNNIECVDHSSSDEETVSSSDYIKNLEFRERLRHWAVEFNIPQVALRGLSKILNERIPNILPIDPRTILHTQSDTSI